MKKDKKPIEISSISMTYDKPEQIPEPIYLNKFSFSARNENNNFDILDKQICSFTINKDNLLELTINVNVNMLYDILNGGINTKIINIKFNDKKNQILFGLDYNVIYRGYSGVEGNYDSVGIMYIKLFYQIVDLYLTESEQKIRLK